MICRWEQLDQRDRLFRYNHPKIETLSTSQISANCGDTSCICHQNCWEILQTSPATTKKIEVTVYPVCLHYSCRAKYLSTYGSDPDGNIGWHNYLLDRIASAKLQILAWGDPNIPPELQLMWQHGKLPTPQQVEQELAAAWGFNFYLEREFLIIRFPPDFARWYVDNTTRHQSFKPVAYSEIPSLISKNIPQNQQQQVLEIINQKSIHDSYYTAWVRIGDINVLMRLRDWRPKGEVIAPLSLREQLKTEAMQELTNYQ